MLVRDSKAALNFTGGSATYVAIGNIATLGFTSGSFTVSYWQNQNASIGSTALFTLAKDGVGQRGYGFGVKNDQFYYETNGAGAITGYGQKYKPGNYYHITAVYNGTDMRVYVNGILDVAFTGSLNPPSSTANVRVGGREYTGSEQGWIGKIDEMKVWNTALTAAQVLSLYNTGINPVAPYLEYLMNEGAGTSLADTGSGANTGTITGATYTADTPSKARKLVNQNLVKNGDFSFIPATTTPFNSGGTTIWLDNSAGGSSTNDLSAWAVFNGTTAASILLENDPSDVGYEKRLKVVLGSTNMRLSNTINTSGPLLQTQACPVLPNTSYTLTYSMKTTGISGSGTCQVAARERAGDGTGGTNNGTGTAITSDTPWTDYTLTFTTASTARYVSIEPQLDGTALDGTIYIAKIKLTPTTPTARQAA